MNAAERKQAFNFPEVVFGHPRRLVQSTALSHDSKVALLRRWKRTLERSRGDGFAGGTPGNPAPGSSARLDDIRRALDELSRQ